MVTTERRRRWALWGGLLLLGSVNHLDLVGVLRWSLEEWQVGLVALAWTLAVIRMGVPGGWARRRSTRGSQTL